jgi:hypothetical protein
MAHFLRVMTKTTNAPTIAVLAEALEQEGFVFATFPKREDERFTTPNWRTFHLSYEEQSRSLMLDRSLRGQEERELEEDVEEFLEQLQGLEGDEGKKKQVVDILNETNQMFALYIPDDITEEGWELAEKLMENLLEMTDGVLQVDGEGFFDKEGELILEME